LLESLIIRGILPAMEFHVGRLFDHVHLRAADLHLAFPTASREDVQRFYQAALAAGGRDNGPPGERKYHPGYYAAYVLDPDGNNLEAVHHGPARRSSASVIITPAG
jgi:catechol 2,3-dioxygenase-like lactoylglutathione lyase family enzyme